MKKPSLLSLIAAFACVALYAQTPDYRFGKVSAEELRMTSYDKDPDAAAVYLYEENSSSTRSTGKSASRAITEPVSRSSNPTGRIRPM